MFSSEEHESNFLKIWGDYKNKETIRKWVTTNPNADVEKAMTVIQQYMSNDEIKIDDNCRDGLQTNLYTLQETTGLLLPNIELKNGLVRFAEDSPVRSTTIFDIWKGKYLGQETCTIKVIRGIPVSYTVRRCIINKTVEWRRYWMKDLGKKYLYPFWGFCVTVGPYPFIVGPWMEDAVTYVARHELEVDDRKRIISGIAEGLKFLHTSRPRVVHGNVRGANVVIDQDGKPLLADFGLLKIVEDLSREPFIDSHRMAENHRWFAPELLKKKRDDPLSKEEDIYAYSMTVLELMTGQRPFSHIPRNGDISAKVREGERPLRPKENFDPLLDDQLWILLTRCWVADPEQRPTIEAVASKLEWVFSSRILPEFLLSSLSSIF